MLRCLDNVLDARTELPLFENINLSRVCVRDKILSLETSLGFADWLIAGEGVFGGASTV